MNATSQQIERATEISAKGVITFDKALAIIVKADSKKGVKVMTSKDVQKMESRNRVETMDSPKETAHEMNTRFAAQNGYVTVNSKIYNS